VKSIATPKKLRLLMLLLCLPALARAADPEPADCATLLRSRCEACHYNTRFCQRLGKKSLRSWKRTIKAMVGYGAKMTAEEQQTVLACLSAPTPAVQEYCDTP
jgi:hypothetical protein